VPSNKKFFYACKWIIDYSRAKKGTAMALRLSEEVLAAYSNQ
jgi:ribosomal protein S7